MVGCFRIAVSPLLLIHQTRANKQVPITDATMARSSLLYSIMLTQCVLYTVNTWKIAGRGQNSRFY